MPLETHTSRAEAPPSGAAQPAPAEPGPPVASEPAEAKQAAPPPGAPPPAEPAPAPKPRPEPGFPYTAARSEIAQQLKFLRTTCMTTGGLVTTKVKFRVDVAPNGTPDVRVYSPDRELRACVRKALSFPFGKSPRGGAFVYTLTHSSADFTPVPLDPDKAGKP